MAYSNRKIPNDTTLFPEPQTWMTWIEDRSWVWDSPAQSYVAGPSSGEGKLRHYHSLPDAKKGLRWIGNKSSYRKEEDRGVFMANWAVYQWNDKKGEWELRYEGFAGQRRDDNPLFKTRFSAGEKVNAIDQKLEDAAIASILQSVS